MSAPVRIAETCSCGASIEIVGGSLHRRDENPANPRSAEEVVERWRTDHHHALAAVGLAPEGER
ncbi:hypothetical protein [Brachybacterium subflavum]|uniref:hypothetical protein n=1 Tax=Brachybacterium subflavum TaxID=2585206 RepID=UPI00126632B4|nr:hypothetical protein [Brachybacterium subflavum]